MLKRVDRYEYWENMPPQPSPRALSWVQRIQAGWRPNNRIRTMGYDGSAEFYGIYLWEYFHVIAPLLTCYLGPCCGAECSTCKESEAESDHWLQENAKRYQVDLEAINARA